MSNSAQCSSGESGTVILDIDHDRILKLNGVAKDMWTLLSEGQTPEQISFELSKKYRVSEEQVSADLTRFLARLETLQVPAPEEPQVVRVSQQPSLRHYPWYGTATAREQPCPKLYVLLAFMGLILFDLVMALSSFKILCSSVRAWPVFTRHFVDSEIGAICAAVQNACVWYPRKALCLQRSAVTTCLLRLQGVPAKMVFGIREMPFLAHAWVEVDGSVVNDWPKVQSFYRAVAAH